MDLDQDRRTLLASLLGLSSCTIFYSMNTTLNYITIPIQYIGRPLSSGEKQGRFIIDSNETPVSSLSHILRQWQELYWRAHRVGPTSALFSTATLFYAGYRSPSASVSQKLFIAGGCWALAAWPFTLLVMVPTNNELHRLGDLATEHLKSGGKKDEVIDEQKTFELLKKWTFLSKARASLSMIAAGCAVAALVV